MAPEPAKTLLSQRLSDWIEDRRDTDRYGLVFVTLVAAFAVGSASDEWGTLLLIFAVSTALVAITTRTAADPVRVLRWLIPLIIAAHVTGLVEVVTVADSSSRSIGSAIASLALLIAPVLVLADILRQRTVTIQTLYAAGAVYLMIGLGFGALYQVIDRLTDDNFFATPDLATEQVNYFSFVTLTTLGYGDLAPMTSIGRALVVVEALIGQLYLATLVARLVTGLRSNQTEPSKKTEQRSGTSVHR